MFLGSMPIAKCSYPRASAWYEPKTIYGNVLISDNVQAFYGMYADKFEWHEQFN